MTIPVIDLFSGPGGLGEGFASLDDGKSFRLIASAEMDAAAHSTLLLRSYFRRVRPYTRDVRAYYDFCNGNAYKPYRENAARAWREAGEEALKLTLGSAIDNAQLDSILASRLASKSERVLIGGPPCQAYSLVGRARNKGTKGYRAEDDHRHFLYREYLRIVERFRPAVFVMENVKGILSSRVGGRRIFHDILVDLADPGAALFGTRTRGSARYRIHSLVSPTVYQRDADPASIDPGDFVVRAENFGIPQARHRVILLGVREDIGTIPHELPERKIHVLVDAMEDLPALRSKLSRCEDSAATWAKVVRRHICELARHARSSGLDALAKTLDVASERIREDLSFGEIRNRSEPVCPIRSATLRRWYHDSNLEVFLNHEARGHMPADLRRYAYAAAYARTYHVSPKGHDQYQLDGLRPHHANWESGKFADRFRAQIWDEPSSTITSHISKDGHYFIHPDVEQCRSLTVREAARLQTFPDNYFFQGSRTEQFHQVGNAVPPMLARQIAVIVAGLLA